MSFAMPRSISLSLDIKVVVFNVSAHRLVDDEVTLFKAADMIGKRMINFFDPFRDKQEDRFSHPISHVGYRQLSKSKRTKN